MNKLFSTRYLLIILLISFSLIIRTYRLSDIPVNFTGDEVEQYNQLLLIKQDNSSPLDICFAGHHACLFSYIYQYFVKIFSQIIFGLRLPQAIIGTWSVYLFFLIIESKFGLTTALLSGFLFSTSYWHLNFSRSVWSNMLVVLLFLQGYFLINSPKNNTNKLSFSAIFSLAVTYFFLMVGHPSGYVVAMILFVFTLIQTIQKKNRAFKISLISLFLSLIILFPYILNIIKNQNRFFSRFISVSAIRIAPSSPDLKLGGIKPKIIAIARGVLFASPFFTGNPENSRYLDESAGPLALSSRILFYLGLIISLLNKTNFFWLSGLFAACLLSLLYVLPPNYARLIFLLPVYYYFIAVAINQLLNYKNHFVRLLFIITLVFMGLNSFIFYFRWISKEITLFHRQPAISVSEISSFTEFSEDIIQNTSIPATVYQYQNRNQ